MSNDDGWRCEKCGSYRWADWRAGPAHEGFRQYAQCVPCGHVQDVPPVRPDDIESTRQAAIARMADALDVPADMLNGPSPDGLPAGWQEAARAGWEENPVAREAGLTGAAPEKTLGQTAYETYCLYSYGRSQITGEPLPAWPDVKLTIQYAWEAAAGAVVGVMRKEDR